MKNFTLALSLFLLINSAHAADPVLSPNAPQDQPVSNGNAANFNKAIAAYVAQARASYPQARQRFLAGLPKGQAFFLTTRLVDKKQQFEQVFIAVQSIKDGVVTGKIWNDLHTVEGYRHGDSYSFPESAILDWLITSPDGSEEGNFVGKYIDSLHAK